MKKRLSFIVGMMTLLACLIVYIFEPDFLEAVSRQSFDAMLRLNAQPPRIQQVVLVDIDEASLRKYGQWPWPRYRLGELTTRLFEEGASVVAFDMAFPENDRLSPAQVQSLWKEIFGREIRIDGVPDGRWDFDREFAAAIERHRVVLGCFVDWLRDGERRAEEPDRDTYRGHYYESHPQRTYLRQAGSIVRPVYALAEAAAGVAFVNTTPGHDNIVRSTPLICAYGPERIYPSLALEAVRVHLNVDTFGIIYDPVGTNGVRCIRMRDKTIPTDAHGRLVLNYRTEPFPVVSARDVIEGSRSGVSLSNKITIVGTSAAGLRDLKATPLYPEMPGFEIQATAIENILSGDMLREPRWMPFAIMAAMIVLGVALALMICRAGAVVSLALALLNMGAVVWFSAWCLKSLQLVVLPLELVLCQVCIYISVTIVEFFLEERERKKIRLMFGTMVSDQVRDYLEEHPESFALTGEKREVTTFFSDIAGFTSIAEKLDPAQVSLFMNRYLTPVTGIIKKHDGYVDKFYGDAVMAIWGAPYPVKDHAKRACLAALEQQEVILRLRDELRRDFGHDLRVRMGINTGQATAGNMGSEKRFNYTVLGDPVNLAARFEPANKEYGTWIIIGEDTKMQADGAIETRLLDLLVVKGESKPVKAYELMGCKGQISVDRRNVADLYERALELHWERKWDEAESALKEALAIDPSDAPCVMLRLRIERYRDNPPEPDWCGEHVRMVK